MSRRGLSWRGSSRCPCCRCFSRLSAMPAIPKHNVVGTHFLFDTSVTHLSSLDWSCHDDSSRSEARPSEVPSSDLADRPLISSGACPLNLCACILVPSWFRAACTTDALRCAATDLCCFFCDRVHFPLAASCGAFQACTAGKLC